MVFIILQGCFTRLSELDRMMLDTNKVLLFIKVVDARDREKVGLLFETDDGLTTFWAIMKRVCNRFDKRRKWNDGGSSSGQPYGGRMTEVPTGDEEGGG